MKLQLVIGNKNYSSWSMRPWVLLRQAQIPFEEVQLKFDDSDGGLRVAGIEKYSAAGMVPVLMIDGEPVWDSLAICETVAEMSRRSTCGRRTRGARAWRARSAPRCTRASGTCAARCR